jgi:hypothetical protein
MGREAGAVTCLAICLRPGLSIRKLTSGAQGRGERSYIRIVLGLAEGV